MKIWIQASVVNIRCISSKYSFFVLLWVRNSLLHRLCCELWPGVWPAHGLTAGHLAWPGGIFYGFMDGLKLRHERPPEEGRIPLSCCWEWDDVSVVYFSLTNLSEPESQTETNWKLASAFSQEMKRRYIEGVEVREEIKVRNIKSIKQNQTSSSFSFSIKTKTESDGSKFLFYLLSFTKNYFLTDKRTTLSSKPLIWTDVTACSREL